MSFSNFYILLDRRSDLTNNVHNAEIWRKR